ncbi:glycosyltransferase [Paenibacillus sp. CGMCC 1.16610]|nr:MULTISPECIES: glycosyltransferase [Paenibacillus]MBA2942399.1 glycosyltransferase [Paenibacillus sp. CGMCC 1.16610]
MVLSGRKSYVIITHNELGYVVKTIAMLRTKNATEKYEIIVVDNCSMDGTREWLAEQTDLRIIFNDIDAGFDQAVVQGLQIASYSTVIVLQHQEDSPIKEHQINIEVDLIEKINRRIDEHFKILDVGCGFGGTLAKVKDRFPLAEAVGVESSPLMANTAKHVTKVYSDNIEKVLENFESDTFDYIIIGPDIFNTDEPVDALLKIKRCLKSDGEILIKFLNSLYHVSIQEVISEKINTDIPSGWTLDEITTLFEKAGFAEIDFDYLREKDSGKSLELIENFEGFCSNEEKQFLDVTHFIVNARKTSLDAKIENLLREIQVAENSNNLLNEVLIFDQVRLIEIISDSDFSKIELLNKLAMHCFDCGRMDCVFPFLNKAYEYSNSNSETALNFSEVMYKLGNKELAVQWLETLLESDFNNDGVINKKIVDIHREIISDNYEKYLLKFMMRRIENNIEKDETTKQLIIHLDEKVISMSQIFRVVENDIMKKDELLNHIAVSCFETGQFEKVIPILEKSLDYNKDNKDTYYNIGYTLFSFQLYEEALNILANVEKDEGLNVLISQIEEKIKHG